MRKKNHTKKLISAISVMTIAAATALTALPLTACSGDGAFYTPSGRTEAAIGDGYVTVDTALGTVQSISSGDAYYVSPTAASEHIGATGDINDPSDVYTLLSGSTLQPGDIVYLLPGSYKLDKKIIIPATVSGSYNNYITLMNAAYDKSGSGYTGTDTTVTLDFSSQEFASTNRGIELYGSYFYWYGIDVCGAGDNGLYVGGNFNTIEFSEFYNNRDTGLQLGRKESSYTNIADWPSYNLIKNCTSHNNYDNETYGENADGFAAKLTIGYGNVFDGCIAYRNSDDGWDLYAKADSGNIGCVIIYNCVAYENGYLEYTRDECNAYYPTYNDEDFPDPSANDYMTRDGDGNGFKLGGSIMEGDVVMYNCLSFQNRMHGVTDNSNPGYLKVEGVTSYDNSAMVDENGHVISTENSDTHSNIDVARQTYSYNTVKNVLSVRSSIAMSLDTDAYRGSVQDSLLDAKTVTNVIAGSTQCDTKNGGTTYTSQTDLIDASAMFKKLPVVYDEGTQTYTYNIDGAQDALKVVNGAITSELLDTRAHVVYRNADGSINMGDILAKTEAGEALIEQLLSGVTAGCDLTKTSWESYTHFYESDHVNTGASSEETAVVERTKDALTINCDASAVYQDFEVPTVMWYTNIAWSTANPEYISFDTDNVEVSVSSSQYVTVVINRPSDEDVQVTITATITYKNATVTKDFVLTLKQGYAQIGDIYAVDQYGDVAQDDGRFIVDQYSMYTLPEIKVKNALYWDSEKLLTSSEYTSKTTYYYQTDSNSTLVQLKGFTPSNAGVYTVKVTVTLLRDNSTSEMSYKIYVASKTAQVDFVENTVNVSVYRDGYIISGEPSSATGQIYSVSSATALNDVTADTIKTYAGVESYDFRDTSVSFNFSNENSSGYYIYYALANANGDITSEIYTVQIKAVEINNKVDFKYMAGGMTIGDENPSQTIYMLTQDLDFTGYTYEMQTSSFCGVFNGLGHTISNLSTTSAGVFYKVTNGTIMNVKFVNLTINNTSASSKIGLVTESTGGYFYNIAISNVNVTGTARVAALIGHVGGSSGGGTATYPLYISQVSIINDEDHLIKATGNRAAGLVGFVQYYGEDIEIDNCQVISNIYAGTGEGGGMIASWEDIAADTLTISKCYYSGTLTTPVAAGSSRLGGILGYHKGGVGALLITQCISLAEANISGEVITISVKNSSGIVGGYSSSAEAFVYLCIALREEYNTNFEVSVFTEQQLRQTSAYIPSDIYLGFDTETLWTVVPADDTSKGDVYKAPYVLLNFLGDWN